MATLVGTESYGSDETRDKMPRFWQLAACSVAAISFVVYSVTTFLFEMTLVMLGSGFYHAAIGVGVGLILLPWPTSHRSKPKRSTGNVTPK